MAGLWKLLLQQVTVWDLNPLPPSRKINEQKMYLSTVLSNNVHGQY
jgi:hypothetical protein